MKADEIIKVLNDLCEKFGIAVDWSSKNVLPYLQELGNKIVAYELWTSVAWIVIGLLPFVIMMILYKKMIKRKELETVFWFSVGFSILSFASTCCQIFDIITCLTFPEKIILEQCMNIYRTYGN